MSLPRHQYHGKRRVSPAGVRQRAPRGISHGRGVADSVMSWANNNAGELVMVPAIQPERVRKLENRPRTPADPAGSEAW